LVTALVTSFVILKFIKYFDQDPIPPIDSISTSVGLDPAAITVLIEGYCKKITLIEQHIETLLLDLDKILFSSKLILPIPEEIKQLMELRGIAYELPKPKIDVIYESTMSIGNSVNIPLDGLPPSVQIGIVIITLIVY